jgi:hypothetical protein
MFLSFRFSMVCNVPGAAQRPAVDGCIGIARSRVSWPISSPSWLASVSKTDR